MKWFSVNLKNEIKLEITNSERRPVMSIKVVSEKTVETKAAAGCCHIGEVA